MPPETSTLPLAPRAAPAARAGAAAPPAVLADPAREWTERARPVLARVLAARGYPAVAPEAQLRWLGLIWRQAAAAGLPAPLAPGAKGNPQGWRDAAHLPAVSAVLAGLRLPDQDLPVAVQFVVTRQLLRGLLAAPFAHCCLSYQRRDLPGAASRQVSAWAAHRPGGAFCEDCPLFTMLNAERHRRVLAVGWAGDRLPEEAQWAALVPEDYRRLRQTAQLVWRQLGPPP